MPAERRGIPSHRGIVTPASHQPDSAVAGSSAGIQVAVAGVMSCDPDDKNIRSGAIEQV